MSVSSFIAMARLQMRKSKIEIRKECLNAINSICLFLKELEDPVPNEINWNVS
jgi:hypothetical protein